MANSFALALVPVISGFVQSKSQFELLNKIKLALRVSATIGVAAAIGLVVTMKPVNHMLFTDVKGTITLAIFSLSILFTSLIMAEAAVIQSLGHSFVPVIITIVQGGQQVGFEPCPGATLQNRWGQPPATVLAYMIMTVLFYVVLRVHIKKTLIEKRHVLIILKSTVYMGTAVVLFNCLFEWMTSGESRLLATVQALTGVGIGAAVFVMTAIRAGHW